MRRSLPLVLLLAACVSDGAVEATTTAVPVPAPTITSATVVESTTTTEAEGPVDICPRGMVWEPGTTYAADCFLVPMMVEPVDEGWGSLGGAEDWLKVRWRAPDDEFRVRMAVIAYSPSSTPEAILDRIAARELISEVSERREVNVGGSPGMVVDVEGDPEPGGEAAAPGSGGCSGGEAVWFPGTYFGHALLDGAGQDVVGLGACDVARIWVVQAGDLTVTIIGGTADPARHEEAVAKIEGLFEGMTFEEAGS